MLRRVYLDNSATTPVDPTVLEVMMPYLTDKFGNASSIHHFGQEARTAVDRARHQVAQLINSRPNEVIFTSGGTEANNLAVRGLVQANSRHGHHVITSAIEHPAVRNVCEDLEKQGFSVTYVPVHREGIVRPDEIRNAVTEETILISVMQANNEIGTIQPVHEIGSIVRELRSNGRKIWLHTDAVQAAGKISIDVEEIGCDLLSLSAHKINAPKGVGALYVRRGTRLHQQNIGGRQERGVRGGTEPVALIAALGAACQIAAERLPQESKRLQVLRDRFESSVMEMVPGASINGDREGRLSNISNISFSSIEGEGLLINLDMMGIAVSTGSACSSGSLEPSPVIRALGVSDEMARGAIRFSFGTFNTDEDVDHTLEALPRSIDALRRLSPEVRR
jgi:cysteine desulfurase